MSWQKSNLWRPLPRHHDKIQPGVENSGNTDALISGFISDTFQGALLQPIKLSQWNLKPHILSKHVVHYMIVMIKLE